MLNKFGDIIKTMEELQEDINYDKILDTLINTFGNVLSRDAYLTIIESCEGDRKYKFKILLSVIVCISLY